jgi:hypothetical protein
MEGRMVIPGRADFGLFNLLRRNAARASDRFAKPINRTAAFVRHLKI